MSRPIPVYEHELTINNETIVILSTTPSIDYANSYYDSHEYNEPVGYLTPVEAEQGKQS